MNILNSHDQIGWQLYSNLPDGAVYRSFHHFGVLVEKSKEWMIDDDFEGSVCGNLAHRVEHLNLLDGVLHAGALDEKA